jgi:hypothetical protein
MSLLNYFLFVVFLTTLILLGMKTLDSYHFFISILIQKIFTCTAFFCILVPVFLKIKSDDFNCPSRLNPK